MMETMALTRMMVYREEGDNSHGQAESDLRLFRFDLDDKAVLESELR